MELEMRPPTQDEVPAFNRAIGAGFGETISDEEMALWGKVIEPSRYLAVYDAGEMVATSGAWQIEQTLPGLVSVPVAGVTAVTVAATHRRQGLLTRMMARMLDDASAAGESIAILTASESVIYGRFGYGWASTIVEAEVPCDRSGFAGPVQAGGRMRRVDKDAVMKVVPALHEQVRRQTVGDISGPSGFYDRLTADFESNRDGAGSLFYALHESDAGEPDGFVAYRYKHDWEHGVSKTVARVPEFLGASPEVEAAVFRYLLDLDLVARVRLERPVDDHLRRRMADPRRYEVHGMGDHVWVRLVDVADALATRRYTVEGEVVIEVVDAFRPQNDGRYLLQGGPDGATCTPTTNEPDMVVPVDTLGAAFLGGASFVALAAAGQAAEGRAGGLVRADAMFRTGTAPFCRHGF
jgi:predicted acetyltransferase